LKIKIGKPAEIYKKKLKQRIKIIWDKFSLEVLKFESALCESKILNINQNKTSRKIYHIRKT
jgi:hypothetical protein